MYFDVTTVRELICFFFFFPTSSSSSTPSPFSSTSSFKVFDSPVTKIFLHQVCSFQVGFDCTFIFLFFTFGYFVTLLLIIVLFVGFNCCSTKMLETLQTLV